MPSNHWTPVHARDKHNEKSLRRKTLAPPAETTATQTTGTPATGPEAATSEATPKTPFYLLGGHEVMQAIVNRFYDLMEGDPAYAELRAMHAPDLSPMRKSLTGFLTAWAGGPRDWFSEHPGKCMMSTHKPFTITKGVAGQWADAMKRAIADVAPENARLASEMGKVLEEMAGGMAKD